MDERRSQQRSEKRVDVEVIAGDTTLSGVTRNLSLGGLCAVLEATLPYGTRVHLRFHLPMQKDPVEVDGEVRWSKQTEEGESLVGVDFQGLRARDVWSLTRFLQTPTP